jgi:hypothetical protein
VGVQNPLSIDIIASRVDRLASDVNLLKLKVMPNNDIDNKITTQQMPSKLELMRI